MPPDLLTALEAEVKRQRREPARPAKTRIEKQAAELIRAEERTKRRVKA